MTITITKRLEIDAGHRLLNHESKCRNIHGHRYAFEFTIESKAGFDEVGRIIDFSIVKEKLGGWLDLHWDHAMIVQDTDPLLVWLQENAQKYYPVPFSPTAENLVGFMAQVARELFRDHLEVVEVACYETPTSVARWRLRG
jgi:6-pyruvoyltetrahydropterin/6-carboxytetrahydropterin synthase